MGQLIMSLGGGSAITSDDCTALPQDILKGKKTITVDSDDEIVEGTLELVGTASDDYVLEGMTYYNTDAHNIRTGTMPNISSLDPAQSLTFSKNNIYVRMSKGAHIQDAISGFPEVVITGTDLGDAAAANVLSGKTFTSKNGLKVTGTIASLSGGTYKASQTAKTISCKGKYMTSDIVIQATNVQSILSFSAASYGNQQVMLTWKNPATGAFSGVYVRGKIGSHPTSVTDGFEVYRGYGSNKVASGTSTATVDVRDGNVYFCAYSYCIIDGNYVYSATPLKSYAYISCDDCDCDSDDNCNGDCMDSCVDCDDSCCEGGPGDH